MKGAPTNIDSGLMDIEKKERRKGRPRVPKFSMKEGLNAFKLVIYKSHSLKEKEEKKTGEEKEKSGEGNR